MNKIKLFFILCIFSQIFCIFALDETSVLKLDLPLLDLPYQLDAMDTVGHGFFSSYANPGMAQSLAVTTDIFSAFHFGMRVFYNSSNMNAVLRNVVYYAGTALGDAVIFYLPFGNVTWMHEEFHRAVMSRYGVNSFNSIYTSEPFANTISVIHITDEDLIRFKAESPNDFIRMHEAGIESENLLIDTLQNNNFFYNKNYFTELVYWIPSISSVAYIMSDGEKRDDEKTIAERDFTGSDPIAWVYDLFKPDEPYTSRGTHASGIGIDRYRTYDDLVDRERDYLKQVRIWQFANFISPMMFGFKSLPWGKTDIRWNFTFRHYLTSFGTDLSLKLLLNINKLNFIAAYHNYQNHEHIFPAIEIEMIDYLVRIGNLGLYISPRIMLGMQPKEQIFYTPEAEFFGLISSRVDFEIHKNWLPYLEITGKTDGWAAGNEFLEKNIAVKLGISARF